MFDENALSKSGQFEVSTMRETQMVIAKIQARCIMAFKRPRVMEVVEKKGFGALFKQRLCRELQIPCQGRF